MKQHLRDIKKLLEEQEILLKRKNKPTDNTNGWFQRYKFPVLTAAHTPSHWRYDLNSFLMERIGMNAVMNSGAIKWNDKYLLVARVEGVDRKSFFAIAESPNGIDNFRFWDYPITMPDNDDPATNIYDMRLTSHEDGWIYGIFPWNVSIKPPKKAIQKPLPRPESPEQWIYKLERLPDLKIEKPAAQRCASSGIREREICSLHSSAGWIYHCRKRFGNWLGVGR